jgi:tetratricopeptide (TPR) repeat protein
MVNSLEPVPSDAPRPQQVAPASAGNVAGPFRTVVNCWTALLELIKLSWRRRPGWTFSMDDARKFTLNTIVVLGVTLGLAFIIKAAFFKGSIVVDPISVPKELAERGYTGEVIAQRIHDEISEVYRAARTPLDRDDTAEKTFDQSDFTTVRFEQTMPRIELPGGGMSLAAVVSGVRELLGLIDTKITGEVTTENLSARDMEAPSSRQTKYLLRLRIIDKGAVSHLTEPTEKLNELVQSAALHVIERFNPVVAAYYYYARHDLHNASRMVNAALKNDIQDDDLAALNLRGLITTNQHLYDEALDEFRYVLERFPDTASTHSHIASVLLLKRSNQEAFEAAQASIKLAPRSARAYNLAGVALIRLRRYDEALNFLRRSNEIDPKFAVAYYNQGIVFRDRKPPDSDKAITMFTRATDANPDYALAYRTWGSLVKNLGKHEKAKILYEKAIAANPKSAASYDLLGDLYLEQLDWEKASDMFRKAQQADPRWLTPRYDLGRAMRVAGRFDEAIAIFEEVVAHDPQHATSYSQWGLTLAQMAQQKQDESEKSLNFADEKLKTALQIRPNDEQVLRDVRNARAILEKMRAKRAEPPLSKAD